MSAISSPHLKTTDQGKFGKVKSRKEREDGAGMSIFPDAENFDHTPRIQPERGTHRSGYREEESHWNHPGSKTPPGHSR